jgi:DMSO/TMAO reductase YedYZ heme-binding membrane subunit
MTYTYALNWSASWNKFSVECCDLAGMLVSSLCVTHCIATPILAGSLPALAATEEQTHVGFGIAILLLGIFAFVPGYTKHHKMHVIALGTWGIFLIGAAAFVPEGVLIEEVMGLRTEVGLTVFGGVTLVTAHMRNATFCRTCRVCQRHTLVPRWTKISCAETTSPNEKTVLMK